jgi:molecular chaperone GrpE
VTDQHRRDEDPRHAGDDPRDEAVVTEFRDVRDDDESPGAGREDDGEGEVRPDLETVAAADPRSRTELIGELLAAEAKRDEYLDDLRRSHADFENYRRRVMRDGAVQRDAGKAEVVTAILDVLDDLDRTLQAADDSADTDLAKGVELVASKLRSNLEGIGLERVDEVGVVFDPNVHEAVQQVEAEGEVDEPRVSQVLRAGYRLGDRTLRASMVVVEQ